MKTLSILAVLLVAALHLWFLVVEMFLWEQPIGLAMFNHTPEHAAQTAMLAANQGLYNGFLVAGLLWGVVRNKSDFVIFFLLCVMVAGVYGAFIVDMKILYIQAAPAGLALVLTVLGLRRKPA